MPFGIEKVFSFGDRKEEKGAGKDGKLPGSFRPGQEVFVEIWGMFGNRGDNVAPIRWEVFGPASKKERQADEVLVKMTYPEGQIIYKDIPINFLLTKKSEPPKIAERDTRKVESKESQLYGFKIGDKVLVKEPTKEGYF